MRDDALGSSFTNRDSGGAPGFSTRLRCGMILLVRCRRDHVRPWAQADINAGRWNGFRVHVSFQVSTAYGVNDHLAIRIPW